MEYFINKTVIKKLIKYEMCPLTAVCVLVEEKEKKKTITVREKSLSMQKKFVHHAYDLYTPRCQFMTIIG